MAVNLAIYYGLIHLIGALLAIYGANRLREMASATNSISLLLIIIVLYLFALGAPVDFLASIFQWRLYQLYNIPSIFFVLFLIRLAWILTPHSRWRSPLKKKGKGIRRLYQK
jgi:Ni/Fe-hydrogenase subunit HybB-like protein